MVVATQTPRPRVLLVSSRGDWAGLLRLPYLLQRAGAAVTMFAPLDCKLRRSRFIDQIYTAPEPRQLFLQALRDHLGRHQYAWVVLGDDPTLVSVAQMAAEQGEGGAWIDSWFPVDRHRRLELIFSKTVFADTAPTFDVPVPGSRVCGTFDQVHRAAAEIGYPLMLKTAIGCAGDGVLRVDKPEALPAAFEVFKHRTPLVVQEFVVGAVGSTQIMFDHGVPICWVPAYKKVCFPDPYGPSCVRELLEQGGVDAMKPIVENIGRMTGFHGMCGIDWIRRADGSFAILEFNPRPTSTIHLGRLMGADCAVALKGMFQGRPAPQTPAECKPSRRVVYMFPQHPARCLRYREFRNLRHWLPFAGVHDVPWQEPLLLLSDLWALTQLGAKRLRQAMNPFRKRTKGPIPHTPLAAREVAAEG